MKTRAVTATTWAKNLFRAKTEAVREVRVTSYAVETDDAKRGALVSLHRGSVFDDGRSSMGVYLTHDDASRLAHALLQCIGEEAIAGSAENPRCQFCAVAPASVGYSDRGPTCEKCWTERAINAGAR